MTIQHLQASRSRWEEFTTVEQMANIGSEVFRLIEAKHQPQRAQLAFARALALLTLSKSDPKNRGGRLKELCRLYECLVDWQSGSQMYHSRDEDWLRYFYQFNYAARVNK